MLHLPHAHSALFWGQIKRSYCRRLMADLFCIRRMLLFQKCYFSMCFCSGNTDSVAKLTHHIHRPVIEAKRIWLRAGKQQNIQITQDSFQSMRCMIFWFWNNRPFFYQPMFSLVVMASSLCIGKKRVANAVSKDACILWHRYQRWITNMGF